MCLKVPYPFVCMHESQLIIYFIMEYQLVNEVELDIDELSGKTPEQIAEALGMTDRFLAGLGYLKGEATIIAGSPGRRGTVLALTGRLETRRTASITSSTE